MGRAQRLVGIAFGVALLAALALGGSVAAQEAKTMTLQLTPSRGSGVSGTATITEVGGGVRVELNMRGLPKAGIKHINHFHAGGSCEADRAGNVAPATIPLKTIVAKADGTGSATTTLEDVTLDQLFDPDKKRYLALHSKTEKGQGVPPVISCADVVEAAAAGAVSTKLPKSGGTHPLVLLLSSGAILTLSGAAGLSALRRRCA
jgi:Cu/Zn superoxide dismutase